MRTRKYNELLIALGLVLTVGFVGCGDDDGSVVTDAGVDASTGNAGKGGTGGGGAGTGSVTPGMCGTTQCDAPPLGVTCCTVEGTGVSGDPYELTGRAPNLCGTDIGSIVPSLANVCLQLKQPGVLDTSCPVVSNGFSDEPGCCTDLGFCGTMSAPGPGGADLGCHFPSQGKGKPCGDAADGGTSDAGN